MSAPGPPVIPALHDTIGAVQIGAVVGTYLFGIETLQAYYYFRHYPTDGKWLKLMVCIDVGKFVLVQYSTVPRLPQFGGVIQHLLISRCSYHTSRVFELGHTISVWHAVS
jgi:hypothetical protein